VFAVVVISGSVLVGNIFVQYRGVNAIAGESKESIPQYRESVVEDALELYHAREEAYKRLRGSVAVTPVLEVASSSVATSTEEI
jgi:carboxypeptidase C (cathepsin A)